MVSGIPIAASPRQDDAIRRSSIANGSPFSRAVSSRASHDKPACTGAMSKEIEYIWGLQRVAHHQGKFIQEGSKTKSQSCHSAQLEAKGVPAEFEGAMVLHSSESSSSAPSICETRDHAVDARAMVLHPSQSSSSAPSACESKEARARAIDALQPGSKPAIKFVAGPACFQRVDRGAGDSHVAVATAGKESGTHSRIVTTQQDLVHGDIHNWSLQLVDCQVPKDLSLCVMEARFAQLGEKNHNVASCEVSEVAAESASQFNQNEDRQAGPRSDPGSTSSTERTDAVPRQTAETHRWDDTGKIKEITEELKVTIRPRDPEPEQPHEILEYHAKMQACYEPEVLQPEHEEMDERDMQENQKDAKESIGQQSEESEEDQVMFSDREDDDSMCEQDRFILDAKSTEEDSDEEEEGRTDSLVETASEEAFQHETTKPLKEMFEENQLGEAWQARGKEEPKKRQGQIYDTEERCCEEIMRFRFADLRPVNVSEDKREREGATTMPHEQDKIHIARSHNGAEERKRSKRNASWLPDEIFRARTLRAFRINASDSTGMHTPWVSLPNNELSLPPKVLAGAVPKAVATDVPAMPSLRARALLSTRHWRGCGSLSKYSPSNSPTLPMPEGTEWQAKPCGGPEMFSIGTPPVPMPMWDPFCKLSTGLDSQSRQPAPCIRPSEHVLRVR